MQFTVKIKLKDGSDSALVVTGQPTQADAEAHVKQLGYEIAAQTGEAPVAISHEIHE